MLNITATIFDFPEKVLKSIYPLGENESTYRNKDVSGVPVDILDTPKEYIFFINVPGLSKSDIQVSVEGEKMLVIRSNGKRKREDAVECKYIRLERVRAGPHKILRKFVLPDNSNIGAISAKCENGVLTVTVEKLAPPPKPNTVQVVIA